MTLVSKVVFDFQVEREYRQISARGEVKVSLIFPGAFRSELAPLWSSLLLLFVKDKDTSSSSS